jgi:hypothetical protein
MPRIHPPVPSQHNSLPNNLKMCTPLDIRKNLGALFCQPSESSATRARHLAAERSTATQIGTWLCPCKHPNEIHNHLASDSSNPLGTLYCSVCGRSWNESRISSTTFISPVRTVKFRPPSPARATTHPSYMHHCRLKRAPCCATSARTTGAGRRGKPGYPDPCSIQCRTRSS